MIAYTQDGPTEEPTSKPKNDHTVPVIVFVACLVVFMLLSAGLCVLLSWREKRRKFESF